jgi:hypothetical protein
VNDITLLSCQLHVYHHDLTREMAELQYAHNQRSGDNKAVGLQLVL